MAIWTLNCNDSTITALENNTMHIYGKRKERSKHIICNDYPINYQIVQAVVLKTIGKTLDRWRIQVVSDLSDK